MKPEGYHTCSSCLEEEGEVRGVQLQHDTSPLDFTKSYTLNLFKDIITTENPARAN